MALNQIERKVSNLTPLEFVTRFLGLHPLSKTEMATVINSFSETARFRMDNPMAFGKGPYMLDSLVKPPESDPRQLEGKRAIGIDIGGTNLRIGVGVIKNGQITPQSEIKPKEIPIKYESADDFFQMLLDNGLREVLDNNPDIPLACIFSFPGEGRLTIDGIDQNIPTDNMTKEWFIGGIAGKNLGEELNKFLERNGLKRRKYFIANDTVALIKDPETDAGIVCASGYNWSIKAKNTIINTEAGSAISAPIISVITNDLMQSIAGEEKKPKSEIALRDEYRISGKYLGKMLGLIVKRINSLYPLLFYWVNNTDFSKSFVVSDILDNRWKEIRKEFKTEIDFSDEEKQLLRNIALSLRDSSAQIVACHFIALQQLFFPDKRVVTVSSDGPIIQNMPGWKKKFLEEISELSENQLQINIRETPYEGDLRELRGILDVMYQACEFFNHN